MRKQRFQGIRPKTKERQVLDIFDHPAQGMHKARWCSDAPRVCGVGQIHRLDGEVLEKPQDPLPARRGSRSPTAPGHRDEGSAQDMEKERRNEHGVCQVHLTLRTSSVLLGVPDGVVQLLLGDLCRVDTDSTIKPSDFKLILILDPNPQDSLIQSRLQKISFGGGGGGLSVNKKFQVGSPSVVMQRCIIFSPFFLALIPSLSLSSTMFSTSHFLSVFPVSFFLHFPTSIFLLFVYCLHSLSLSVHGFHSLCTYTCLSTSLCYLSFHFFSTLFHYFLSSLFLSMLAVSFSVYPFIHFLSLFHCPSLSFNIPCLFHPSVCVSASLYLSLYLSHSFSL